MIGHINIKVMVLRSAKARQIFAFSNDFLQALYFFQYSFFNVQFFDRMSNCLGMDKVLDTLKFQEGKLTRLTIL